MGRFFIIVIAVGVAGLVAACNQAAGGGDSASIERGRQLYNTGGVSSVPCATCHTLDGSDLVGPSFKGLKEQAATRIQGMSAQDYLRQSIIDPSAYVVTGYPDQMFKDYGKTLSQRDITDLIAFLMAQ